MATKANPSDQLIAPRDQSALSALIQNIESSKYARALSSIETLLTRYPTNGELVVSKGLCIALANPTDETKRDEGEKLIKQGVMFNLKSHKVWHLQGLYYRRQRQYSEALKSFQQAAKMDPAFGKEIINDIASLQVQARAWEPYIELRRTMLVESIGSPTTGWLGYATANHMAGRYDIAIEALRSYQKLQFNPSLPVSASDRAKVLLDTNQLVVYRVSIYLESGNYTDGLADLEEHNKDIIDRVTYHTLHATFLLHLGRNDEAIVDYTWLLNNNCEEVNSIEGYFKAKGVDNLNQYRFSTTLFDADEGYTKVKEVFTELLTTYSKSSSIMKIALASFIGDDFVSLLSRYVIPNLQKGVPSLFTSLSALYEATWKKDAIETYMLSLCDHLRQHGSFPSSPDVQESPTSLLSTLCYLARHYDFLGESTKALTYLDEAEQLTPTFIDIYVFRAGVYKHMGDEIQAHYWMDYARRLDTADRYLNNKTTRYAYQALADQHGEHTLSLFVKEETSMESYQYSQQASWYHTQQGLCYKKKRINGLALKKLLTVSDHFKTYFDATRDYNLYVLRRSTYQSHVNLLRYVDVFYKHKFHVRAILPAIEILLEHYSRFLLESKIYNLDTTDKTACEKQVTSYRASIEDQLSPRPLNVIREKLLKQSKSSDDDVSVTFTPNHPDIDTYGWKHTDASRKFLPDAVKYINQLVNAFEPKKRDSLAIIEPQPDYSHVCPITSVLFLSVTAACYNKKALYALKMLKHTMRSIDQFTQLLSGNEQSRKQSIRQQIAYLSWFGLSGVSTGFKQELLPLYLHAQLFVSKIQVSSLFLALKNELSYTDDQVKSAWVNAYNKSVEEGILVNDITAAFNDYTKNVIGTSTNATAWAINTAGLLLALYYSNTRDFPIQLDITSVPCVQTITPSSRIAFRSLITACEIASGREMLSQPSITGVELSTDDACVVSIPDQTIEDIKQYAHTHFPSDTKFLSLDAFTQLKETHAVELPPLSSSP